MSDNNFPLWLNGKEKAVAEALLVDGFWYCGNSERFCIIEELTEPVGNWLLGFTYQELGIDAICTGALFFKDLDHLSEQTEFEHELSRIKELIIKSERDWKSGLNTGQLSLFEVDNEGV